MPWYEFKVKVTSYVELEAGSREEAEDRLYDDPIDYLVDGDYVDLDVSFRRELGGE